MSSTAGQNWIHTLDRPRVLVGVDGSADGLRAVRYGARFAVATGAVLHLVHAVDDAVLAGAWGVVYDPSSLQEAGREAAEEAARLAMEEGMAADDVHAEVQLGNAAGLLARLSEGASLVVAGRRSMGGLERMFVGSTSVALAGSAHCPVLVISDASTPERTGERGRIAVGVDDDEHSSATLEWAMAEAERRGAALDVVHIAPNDEKAMVAEQAAAAARQGIDEMLHPLLAAHPGVDTQVVVTSGNAVDELVDLTQRVDLLVLGAQRPKLLGIHLGGVMRGVLAHAASPVVLVR